MVFNSNNQSSFFVKLVIIKCIIHKCLILLKKEEICNYLMMLKVKVCLYKKIHNIILCNWIKGIKILYQGENSELESSYCHV